MIIKIGSISTLYRYPVKSMMGEELRSSEITEHGLAGDRTAALLDVTTGKIASAKNPKQWPNMFSYYSRYEDFENSDILRITLPDGSTVKSNGSSTDSFLSSALGKQVKLITKVPLKPQLEEYCPDIEELDKRNIVSDENMPAGTFFDLAHIHIITTATLDKLRELYPDGRFETRRFRPNIVIKTEDTGFIENNWIGKTIAIGDEVQIKITAACPRCVMTTLAQSDLPHDNNILKTAIQHNKAHVGVYAATTISGTIKCNDSVGILD